MCPVRNIHSKNNGVNRNNKSEAFGFVNHSGSVDTKEQSGPWRPREMDGGGGALDCMVGKHGVCMFREENFSIFRDHQPWPLSPSPPGNNSAYRCRNGTLLPKPPHGHHLVAGATTTGRGDLTVLASICSIYFAW